MYPEPAADLAGLPAPVPDDVPGPPAAAQGGAVGAQQPRRQRAQRARGLVAAAGARSGRSRRPACCWSRGWLTDGFADDAQSAEYRRRSRAMVEGYVARLDPPCEPAGVERTVATKTDLIAVSGRIDRLDDRPAAPGREGSAARPGPDARELVVVDYKTGRHPLTVDDARSSLALALYALAAGAGAAPALPHGGTASPADRARPALGAHRGVPEPAAAPGRGHRRRVLGGGREVPLRA